MGRENTDTNPTKWNLRLAPRNFNELKVKEYIEERLNSELLYYNSSAGKFKQRYLHMRAATVIGGALVPVLLNIEFPYIKVLTTALSLLVVLIVSLETVYRYRDQWINYRTAEQRLKNEYFLFTSKAGGYAAVDENHAFTLFVNRIEAALEAENASTLSVMTSLSESKTAPPGPSKAHDTARGLVSHSDL